LLMDRDEMRNRYRGPSIDSINKHGRHRQFLFFDWLISKISSPLKPLAQMIRNLVGSIYGRSPINNVHFVPIHYQTWPPQAILVSDWLISKTSSPLNPHGQDNRRRIPSDGKSSHCLRQGELKRGSILYLSTCEFLYPIHYPLFNLYKLASLA
jgi:hypothetical protein